MRLAQFTEPKLLVPRLLSGDQFGALRELAKRLQNADRIDDAHAFFEAVLEREYMLQTTPELGVAFPHARGRGVNSLSYAVGLSTDGLTWGPAKASRVQIVFLFAVPISEARPYLMLLSGLSRFAQDEQARAGLLACSQPEQILERLAAFVPSPAA
jgi:mannitol/fructose-specific phosphotransferase system IIA component (Ntr-type)